MHGFWGKKKLVQLKIRATFVTYRVKARWSKNRAAQGFHYINSFSSNFLDPIQKCAPARSVQLEAVYLEALLYYIVDNAAVWLPQPQYVKSEINKSKGTPNLKLLWEVSKSKAAKKQSQKVIISKTLLINCYTIFQKLL